MRGELHERRTERPPVRVSRAQKGDRMRQIISAVTLVLVLAALAVLTATDDAGGI